MDFQLTNTQARALVLTLQGLADPPRRKLDLAGLQILITRLGFVQVDSIQWVERAHHMTLFARNETYRPKQLVRLLEKERQLFENWTHDASVIPCEFHRYWRHKFARDEEKLSKKFTQWQGAGFLDHCAQLIERVEKTGGVRSRDLVPENNPRQDMWQWHDGKAALEYLWRTGPLAISAREGFQKVYDLTERVVPDDHRLNDVTHDAFVDWACRSALDRLGFATAGDIARYWDLISIREVQQWLERQSTNSVVTVSVAAHDGSTMSRLVAPAHIHSLVSDLEDMPKRIRVLSPFDPVIRDRKRLSWLFGFDYRIEIYVPEAKRKWGYYVFPLLEGTRLIGRIDMRARRKDGVLEVKKLWLEPKVKMGRDRWARLESELERYRRFCGVDRVVWLDGATDG